MQQKIGEWLGNRKIDLDTQKDGLCLGGDKTFTGNRFSILGKRQKFLLVNGVQPMARKTFGGQILLADCGERKEMKAKGLRDWL